MLQHLTFYQSQSHFVLLGTVGDWQLPRLHLPCSPGWPSGSVACLGSPERRQAANPSSLRPGPSWGGGGPGPWCLAAEVLRLKRPPVGKGSRTVPWTLEPSMLWRQKAKQILTNTSWEGQQAWRETGKTRPIRDHAHGSHLFRCKSASSCCPPPSVCQTVHPNAWSGTEATRRMVGFLPPTVAQSLCQPRTLPLSLPAQGLPPHQPQADPSREAVSAWDPPTPRPLALLLPSTCCACASASGREGQLPGCRAGPSLMSGLRQGQARWPPPKFSCRARATAGLFGLEMRTRVFRASTVLK